MNRKLARKLVWNFTFGVEDSLVSTVGLVSGIAAGGVEGPKIFLTGSVLIVVEALSMAVGSFMSDQTAEEYLLHKEVPMSKSVPGAAIMFVSYLLSGLIPIIPYLTLPQDKAFGVSISITALSLFVLGVFNGWQSRINPVWSGLRMIGFGSLAIVGGVLVGRYLGS